MKTKILITLLSSAVLVLSSCTQNFEEINTNPNNPDIAPLTNVFANVIEDITERFGTTEMEYPAAYVGHVTKGTYTTVTNYQGSPSTDMWNGTYRSTLSNVNFVIEGALENENNNLWAAATVLKTYAMQMVTDVYGKVPYFEAGQGADGLIHPKYDSEEAIYADLLKTLDEANEKLVPGAENGLLGAGDLLYYGDITKWKKFCNSLHLRVAIRMSNVDETTAKAEISKILSNPDVYPVFTSNEDNAFLAYPGDEDWIEPWTARHSSIGDDWMAKPIVDVMNDLEDPRLEFYAAPLTDGTYSGLEVGKDADIKYSRVNDLFVNNPGGSVYFLKFAEVQFIRTEAIMRGFVNGSAKDAYESAITASCEEYGIGRRDISNYIEGFDVEFANDLNQVYLQKWIALFRQSWEAWAEMRRTDVPALSPAVNSVHSGHNRPPFRFSYPDSERKLNSANVPADVNEVHDYWGYQIWWDTRSGVQ
ncbi:SusD/RagB family nutrient-binding outer membrane lipoprotein [Maribellus sediminis]|uniref:SusD/RagB family nutrient-binding outer membrane lipoprotein n=1 Tax=Maribellus sediminis TaxID=2696285 RepID=UPI0014304617|nr:SusD/RagB family nutrient-binding outer membrane lipoprotein [Maribellus sediminis]